MAGMKRITDLTQYASVLPYASELFGVYQPLLGWKSARIVQRFQAGLQNDRRQLLDRMKREFAPAVSVNYANNQVTLQVDVGTLKGGRVRATDSVVLRELAAQLPSYASYTPSVWAGLITQDRLKTILQKSVVDFYTKAYPTVQKAGAAIRGVANPAALERRAFERQVQYESEVAGALLYLLTQKQIAALEQLFYVTEDHTAAASSVGSMLAAANAGSAYLSLDTLDPTNGQQLQSVILSPISVVHLFRQYFFELDTFLGPSESHVWLSPGSTVELIEVHTRQTTVERSIETALETTNKSETSTTQQDEISEAVKQENDQDTKFGASVKASYEAIEATSSLDYASSQKDARETTHKRTREQTEKLSSEIRRNFKTTFKVVTEFTDVSSTKHVLNNTTNDLINYELRRKMRQVGVQVQDVGTFLCWQAYVDDPGRQLGIAELIHIATPADLESIPHPAEIPLLEPVQEEKEVTIPFISVDDSAASNSDVYVDGVDDDDVVLDWLFGQDKIQTDFAQTFVSPRTGYELTNVEFDAEGRPLSVSRRGPIVNASGQATFTLHLDSADFQKQNSTQIKLILHWSPSTAVNDAIIQKNKDALGAFQVQERAAYQKAYIDTLKDRVTKASKITARAGDDLREEERIVVYRALIQDLLTNGVQFPDDRTRHVVAEVLDSIFDVDKMLYFVAPEWWRPRLHRSRQQLPETPAQIVDPGPPTGPLADATVLNGGLMRRLRFGGMASANSIADSTSASWGGVGDPNRDNYYITDESGPAKLGSSLGWLLQLDGDNMRNAFLNAPWVKAVLPIRPGKEEAALAWLKAVEGMDGITDDVVYHSSNSAEVDIDGHPLEGQKLIDVLHDLGKKIKRKYEEGIQNGKYPKADEVSDPALVDDQSTVTATPIDRVYEHGFFPLQGGFRFDVTKNYEIFDQWLEILPTDQTVPVAVKYDPKTGRQIEP
jgi:hypothetical protein